MINEMRQSSGHTVFGGTVSYGEYYREWRAESQYRRKLGYNLDLSKTISHSPNQLTSPTPPAPNMLFEHAG
jgi:hypothetical protein